ncbi:insulinase family protein [Acidobacteria bacterium ACD]|nr:MAG: insulinase family protein [Acidobacteriota bacterium]MDL1952174.1 insulinase family protein [Acidobacteria bacterium ACD]
MRRASRFLPVLLLPAALLAVDRSKPPAAGEPRPFRMPATTKLVLGNGLPVTVAEMREVPVVSAVLVVKSGAAVDPPSRHGLAWLVAELLDEGAAGRDALALDDAISVLGARLTTRATWDGSSVSLSVPASRFPEALALMADVAVRPDFPEKELTRVRKETFAALLAARSDPDEIARRALLLGVFGKSHRYGAPLGGDARTLSAIGVADVRSFHSARYRPGNAALVVAGDVTAASLAPLLERTFGSWEAGATASAAVPAPKGLATRRVLLVDKPGAEQSALRAGLVGPPRATPDLPVLEVVNTLLGGSFTSRLNDNLRERHGWTYGAYSYFDTRKVGGLFAVATDVETAVTADAVSEIVKELQRIRTPAPPAEVDRARRYYALGLPKEVETTGQVAARLADSALNGLPDGYWEDLVARALAADGKALQAAARARIDPGVLSVVVVGDRAKVEAPLRALKLGDLTVATLDEVMGAPPPE